METLKKNKKLLVILVVTFILFIGYFFWQSSGSTTADQTVTTSDMLVGQDILTMLNKVSALQIDNSLFTSPAWMALQDISVTIPTTNPGKSDLFGPLGR